jgi:hypothetical protein
VADGELPGGPDALVAGAFEKALDGGGWYEPGDSRPCEAGLPSGRRRGGPRPRRPRTKEAWRMFGTVIGEVTADLKSLCLPILAAAMGDVHWGTVA